MISRRRGGIIAVFGLVLVLLSLFAAPRANLLQQGSTYSRAPSGYGAWYAYLQQQSVSVYRWQKPLDVLINPSQSIDKAVPILDAPQAPTPSSAITLVQISPRLGVLNPPPMDWIKQGNVYIQVGVSAPATRAPFRSVLQSPVGGVKIETSRRLDMEAEFSYALLKDAFGTVVTEAPFGRGRVVSIAAPFLAANAYQDEPGNFKFLAELVKAPGHNIYIDEYLHGYKDRSLTGNASSRSLVSYLAQTPLLLVLVQGVVILLVLIWGQNRRLGPALTLTDPPVDNSEAYIQALAGVLQKARCSEFVVETVNKAERLHLQRSLGLTSEPLPPEILTAAWTQQTGRSAADLDAILAQPRRLSDRELLTWLRAIQGIRRSLPGLERWTERQSGEGAQIIRSSAPVSIVERMWKG